MKLLDREGYNKVQALKEKKVFNSDVLKLKFNPKYIYNLSSKGLQIINLKNNPLFNYCDSYLKMQDEHAYSNYNKIKIAYDKLRKFADIKDYNYLDLNKVLKHSKEKDHYDIFDYHDNIEISMQKLKKHNKDIKVFKRIFEDIDSKYFPEKYKGKIK